MTHVPFEYATVASVTVTVLIAGFLMLLPFEVPGIVLVVILAFSYVIYSYSPLPQGPSPQITKDRIPSWGFTPQYEDGPQSELEDFNDQR